jgi:homoserine dehydrogenase
VAILGFGTVGRALAKLIGDAPQCGVTLTRIVNREIERKRVEWVPDTVQWSEALDDAVRATDVDVVVELLGGIEPAYSCIRAALQAGKPVVTANKQVMAHHGVELFAIARRARVALQCEAAAGGAMPIVRALAESLRADRITRFAGVLNGTSNYVLERRAAGVALQDAVRDAQRAGLAEANPDRDLDGHDAAAKLALLSMFGFGVAIDPGSIGRRSIATIDRHDFVLAQQLGLAIKPVAYAARSIDGFEAWTGPALVPLTSPLAAVSGARNAFIVSADHSGETVFAGEGAGGEPTAVTVLSDVLSAAHRGRCQPPLVNHTAVLCEDPAVAHLVRLEMFDRTVALPAAISRLHRHQLSVSNVMTVSGDSGHVALRLLPCRTRQVDEALSTIVSDVPLRGRPAILPMLCGDPDVRCR